MQQAGMDFIQWLGKSVVLQVVSGDLRVPVWGTILGTTEQFVCVQVDHDWFIQIEKSTIEAVVEVDAVER
jgi:hypothetical protein